ncbi:MAG: DsbA family protein [Anaerolineales bacterium]
MAKKAETKSKRQIMKEQRIKRQKQQRLITLGIIVVAVLIIAGLIIYPNYLQAKAPVGDIVQITPIDRPQVNFNATGDPNAPVHIIDYSDFQCPYCGRFARETEPLIIENYIKTGKVYFEFIPYGPGGIPIGQESADAAMAAFCAGDQGKFWEYHDILFANQTGENVGDFTLKRLSAFAQTLGLNMDQFNSCMKSKKFESKLQEGIAQGKKANIGGTPSFLINGKLVEGALPYEEFKKEIDAALQAAGVQP